MNATLRVVLITYLVFAIHFIIDTVWFSLFRRALNRYMDQLGVAHIIAYVLVGIPIVIGLRVIHGERDFLPYLGFDRNILKGLGFALLCTLPMFIGYAFFFEWNSEVDLDTILISVVAAGFFEEVYYRGFLFGQVFRYTRFGFIPAVILGALLFAAVHLYQSSDPVLLVGIFTTTLLGGLLFAWVYAEWDFNICVPIGLHAFMNLAWELFDVSDNAFGNLWGNVFRITTIVLIIVLTVWYKRRNSEKLAVNKKTIWWKTKYE